VNTTGWLKGLRVTADGTGIVSHAGVALLRALSDNIGLTAGLSRALASRRLLVHDRGRVLADLACAIADGAEVISDFRVIGDQQDLFGLVASVPTAWRTLDEIARGGERALGKITSAVNAARRRAWAQIAARHGALPGIAVADKVLDGVTCIRIDASVVTCHSDKEGAEPNFKGFGYHPLLGYCDNTGEPLAGMLRRGSAGSNTAADHLAVLDAAIAVVPAGAWQIAVDPRGQVRERRADQACGDPDCGHRRCWIEEAHVTELTGLLRDGPAGDQLERWPASMRVFARRERPHPGAQLTLFEAEDGCRYTLWVTNLPRQVRGWRGQLAYIDAAHRVHARVEDAIRTGKDCGIGKYPSTALAMNKAWQAAALTAATLLAWLRLLALDGHLARAEPKTLRYRILHAAARLTRGGRRRSLKIQASWPWAAVIVTAWARISALPQAP